MESGKLASLVYKSVGIPDGAESIEQFGDILIITVQGRDYPYQVTPLDSFEDVTIALDRIIENRRLVAA